MAARGSKSERATNGVAISDVFISYAAEDEEFVDRLRGALARHGRDAWVYTEEVLPADIWRRAAMEGVEQSDAVVFVISAASLTSSACREELDYTAELNKRLIPVCIEEPTQGHPIPADLEAMAWIMMRSADDFEAGLDRLVRALDTDLTLARVHTRILVRARAWEDGARDDDPLLRGDELKAATGWLERVASDGGPQPTELQREFVAASVVAQRRRRRRRIATVLGSAAILIGLIVLAIALQGQSKSRQQIAASRELATQATDELLNGHLDVGILLGLEAEHRARTVEAVSSVTRAVESIPAGMVAFRVLPHAGVRAAYSPDGRAVAFASGSIWDTRTGAVTKLAVPGSPTGAVAFSPDGRVLALGADPSGVTLWDARAHRLLRTLSTHGDLVDDVAFAPDGASLAAATSGGTIPRWDTRTGQPVGAPLRANAQVNAVAFAHDGGRLAAGTDTGDLTLFDAASGRAISRASLGDSIYQVAFSKQDKLLAAAASRGVHVTDLATGSSRLLQVGGPPANHRGNPQVSVAFSPTSQLMATSTDLGHVMLWDLVSGHALQTITGETAPETVAFSPDGATLVTADVGGRARLWDVAGELSLGRTFAAHQKLITGIAFSPDGRLLAVARDGGGVEVGSADGAQVLWSVGAASGQAARVTIAFRPDSRVLVTAGSDQQVRFRNAQTGQAIRATHIGSGGAASFSPDGRLLAVGVSGGAGTIALLDGAGRVTKMLQAGANVSAIAWVANDRLAAVSDTGVSVWSTHGGKLAQLQAHSDDPPSIAASPNGHVLGILGVTGALSLWDTARLRPLRTLPIDNGGTQLAFTGDGRTLAAGDDSGLVRMWDVQSGQALGAAYRVAQRIAAQPTGIDALAFDPAQTTLALGTSDGTVGRLEHLPFAGPGAGASASATYLCGVVRRSLTRSEWQQLVPDQPYRATCGPRF